MKKRFNGTYSYQRDIGKIRLTNEDESQICVNAKGDVLLMVADGMGGHKKGDYASHETINLIKDEFEMRRGFANEVDALVWIKKTIKKANNQVFTLGDKDIQYAGMGTTLVLALIRKARIYIANIGDSRCYIYKDDKLQQISEDQTYVNYLCKSGKITADEMKTHPKRHVLTNAIGLFPSVSLDLKILDYSGEKVFLCSDGLYNNVSIPDITNILKTDESTELKVSSLINLANFNGGSDNISIALWEVIND